MISIGTKNEVSSILDSILEYIFSDDTLPNKVLFKGGTALAKVYGINRFSKDIDLSYIGTGYGNITYELRDFVEGLGLAITNLSSNTMEFKVGQRKSSIDISYLRDVMNRDVDFADVMAADGRKYFVKAMDIDEILAEKFRAMMERKEGKDLFDAYAIIKKGIACKKEQIDFKCMHSEPQFPFDHEKFFEILDSWTEHRYIGQISDYVEKQHVIPLKDIKQELKGFIKRIYP